MLFKNIITFLIDRFTGRNSGKYSVQDRVFTTPNLVTISGILLTWFYVFQVYAGFLLALVPITCVIICLSDALDGFLADRLNEHSKYGKLLDPVRDRLFTFALLWNVWYIAGNVVLFPIFIALFAESSILLRGAIIFRRTGKPSEVHAIGKVRTFVQWLATMGVVVQEYWFGSSFIDPLLFTWIVAVASIMAFCYYFCPFEKK